MWGHLGLGEFRASPCSGVTVSLPTDDHHSGPTVSLPTDDHHSKLLTLRGRHPHIDKDQEELFRHGHY